MIHDTNIKNALNAISKEPKPIPIPETAAGGIRATAIATPTIISGIAVISANPPAIPSSTATIIPIGLSSVLDCRRYFNRYNHR